MANPTATLVFVRYGNEKRKFFFPLRLDCAHVIKNASSMQQDYGALIKGPNGPDGFNQLGHCGSCTYVIESEFFTSSAHSKLTFSLVTRSDLTHEE